MAQHTGTESGPKAEQDNDEAAIQTVLDLMARAVTSGDGRAVASQWEAPALVIGDEMVRAVASTAELEPFFASAKQQYNKMGIVDTRAEIVRLDWVTERIAIARVRWPYLDATGNEVGEETSTYTFRRDDSGALKLRTAVMHGAAPRH